MKLEKIKAELEAAQAAVEQLAAPLREKIHELKTICAEHAALLAVAEAASEVSRLSKMSEADYQEFRAEMAARFPDTDSPKSCAAQQLNDALANLAAVRKGNGGIK